MKRDTLLALGLFALAFWHFLGFVEDPDRDKMGYHRDEARWIHRSYFLEELFHPNSPTWSGANILTLGQPPLGSYLMGIGLWVQGRELGPNGFYDFGHNVAWNEARGNVPDWPDLYAGRRTNAFVGALTVVLVYLIGRKLAGRVGGVAGALVLIPHPLNTYLTTFAGSDALLIFLVAAAALLAIFLAERPTWLKAIGLGVLIGLGGATKLTPIALAFPLAALGVAILAYDLPKRLRAASSRADGANASQATVPTSRTNPLPLLKRLLATVDGDERALGWMLLTLPVVAFATFIAIYPFLWSDPIGNTKLLFNYRSEEMANQAELYTNTQVAGPIEAIERVRDQLGGRTSTGRWLSEQIALRFDRAPYWPGADIKLGVLGLALLAAWAMMFGPKSPHALALIIVGGEAGLIILFMQVDFNRYHLPILLTLAVGVGFFAGQAWNALATLGRAYETWRTRGRSTASSAHLALPSGPTPSAAALPSNLSAVNQITIGGTSPAPRPGPTRPRPSGWIPTSVTVLNVTNRPAASPSRPIIAAILGLGLLLARIWIRLRALTRPNTPA